MIMKKMLMTVIAGTILVGSAACSATRTQRSAGEHVDDAVLLTRVKSALVSNPTTEARSIDVDVNRAVVSLSGFVDTESEKEQAGKVARSVDGVADVENHLSVQESSRTAGEVIDDSVLTAKVKGQLIANKDTKAHQINVETREGVVQLSGFVDSEEAKSAAAEVAKSVTGVKDVKNELTVKSY